MGGNLSAGDGGAMGTGGPSGDRTEPLSLAAGDIHAPEDIDKARQRFTASFNAIEGEIGKVIVGMRDVVRVSLASFFAGGHILLEGHPGLAKTTLAKSMAGALGLDFHRIQFTPDMLPADITGSQVLISGNGLIFQPGPVFTNILLADEINRTHPKTLSALLEAMEERQITWGRETHRLPVPLFVIATRNPDESEGTYPLPDAQIDRFLANLILKDPGAADLLEIVDRTTREMQPEIVPVFTPENGAAETCASQKLVKCVVVSPELSELCAKFHCCLHPNHPDGWKLRSISDHVQCGPSPRGLQSLILLAKTFALIEGRMSVTDQDIRDAALPVYRHRVFLKFESLGDVSPDTLINEALHRTFPA